MPGDIGGRERRGQRRVSLSRQRGAGGLLQRGEQRQAGGDEGGLGVDRLAQRLLRTLEAELGKGEAEGGVSEREDTASGRRGRGENRPHDEPLNPLFRNNQ